MKSIRIGDILKKIEELNTDDFPQIKPEDFERWQSLRKKSQQTMLIAMPILIVGLAAVFFLVEVEGAIWNFAVAGLFIVLPLLVRRLSFSETDQFQKKIGLSEETIRAALKGD